VYKGGTQIVVAVEVGAAMVIMIMIIIVSAAGSPSVRLTRW
jgi:hypothetical protein